MYTTPWMVNLTQTADADLEAILDYTLQHHGLRQLDAYAALIESAVRDLSEQGDNAPLLQHRYTIAADLFSYPIARAGSKSPHHLFVSFAINGSDRIANILRILHERMDPDLALKDQDYSL